ncbi:MAG: cupin domain-containing protein [Actinobacteria bacterium]|uniref:Unannotated protein n=1 Tax=freshwater metagenome TaxID=449393 RepID=A0A6J5ZTD9_9ZZZZ|nr:cupin domain-containing protein [Actinomycetota bacterium]
MSDLPATTGDGWAASSLDELGEGPGFRKIRQAIEVEQMGVNAIVLPGRYQTGFHWHDEQEEVYFVHQGSIFFEFGDGSEISVGAGGVVRVDAQTRRRIRNEQSEEAVVVVFGAKGGYVGRDGRMAEEAADGGGAPGARAGGPLAD